MRILITGITGMAGSHLADYLLKETDHEIYGTVRWRSKFENIKHIEKDVHLIETELKDYTSVKNCLEKVRPDAIFHLAAQSFVPASWNSPADTFANNVTTQINLFEAIRELKLDPVVQIAGSSEEYGMVYPNEVPITENNELRPLSPYAVSKVTQEYLAKQYYASYGIRAIVTRTFNHTGPRRGEHFVESNFAKQFVEIEKGLREPVLYVGNLEAKRDFTDVRDVVRGYYEITKKGQPGEVYQMASGKAYAIYELIDMLKEITGIEPEIVEDPERMRPSDVPILLGSYKKMHEATGWDPEISFVDTVSDLVTYWREKIQARSRG